MLIFFIALLELITLPKLVPNYLLPPPHKVIIYISNSFRLLIYHTLLTCLEAFLGFILAIVMGFLVSIVFAHSRFAERALLPYTIALKAVPIIAIAPLLVVWFGNGLLTQLVMSALICFFPIVVNVTIGLRSVSSSMIEFLRSISASRLQIFWYARIPVSLPYLFSGLKIASTLSLVGAIVAELSGADRGLGYLILTASYTLDTVKLFAAIISASLAGIIFFYSIYWIEKKLLFWHESTMA